MYFFYTSIIYKKPKTSLWIYHYQCVYNFFLVVELFVIYYISWIVYNLVSWLFTLDFLFFCLFISIFGNYFVVFPRDSRILWLHDTIYFWFAVCLRGYYEFHSNVEILRFDKNTIPNFPVKQSPGQFWYNCGCFWPRKKIFKNV